MYTQHTHTHVYTTHTHGTHTCIHNTYMYSPTCQVIQQVAEQLVCPIYFIDHAQYLRLQRVPSNAQQPQEEQLPQLVGQHPQHVVIEQQFSEVGHVPELSWEAPQLVAREIKTLETREQGNVWGNPLEVVFVEVECGEVSEGPEVWTQVLDGSAYL